ncbi:MAG: response regulator [Planctomycetota bacterium]|nr:response regulator [Planctomycetota bacterium]
MVTSVLVVDDSAVDRKLISTLLSKNTDWKVDVCDDGDAALLHIGEHLPDLVISDLKMPEMDGFQLVHQVKTRYPVIPVIIITSQGSEDLALEALKGGAASYCPKSRMARDLIAISKSILAVSLKQRKTEQVLSRITKSSLSFSLENDSTLIPPTIEHLQSHMIGWDETERLRVGVALDESLLNAMHHGNLEVDSALRDEGDGSGYRDEIEKRTSLDPYRDRKVKIDAEISEEEIVVRVEDEGPGFEPNRVPDPTSAENLEKPSGRGLLLIRTFMTQVSHNESGNQITMVKKRNTD